MIAATSYLPKVTRASFLIFFSATMLLLPLAWQAAQLAVKTPAPFSISAASAGRLPNTATSKPSAAPNASGLKTLLVSVGAATPAACACNSATASPLARGAVCGADGATKHCTPQRATEAAIRRHATFDMAKGKQEAGGASQHTSGLGAS